MARHALARPDGFAAHPDAPAILAAAEALAERFGEAPELAVVLGSGLGPVVEAVEDADRETLANLSLPSPSVAGHGGVAVRGRLGAVEAVVMQGRVHLYEGRGVAPVVRAVRALVAWGVPRLLLTNAAGSLRADLPPARLVRLTDHLDLTGANTLWGPPWGTRFPDPGALWNGPLGAAVQAAAGRAGVELPEGVYAAMPGPVYETAAEVRLLRQSGADLAGMSTVPEAVAALAVGADVAGVSVVTNYGAGVASAPVDHDAVMAEAGRAAGSLVAVLRALRLQTA